MGRAGSSGGRVFLQGDTTRPPQRHHARGPRFKISVTTEPEDGKATAAVTEALAHALGVAKSRLTLLRGAISREKVFRLD